MKKIWLLTAFAFVSCEKEEFIEEELPSRLKPDVSMVEQTCCDWDSTNFQFEFQ